MNTILQPHHHKPLNTVQKLASVNEQTWLSIGNNNKKKIKMVPY